MRPRVSRLETSISEPAWLMIARELAAIAQTGPCAGRGCRPWPRSGRGKAGPGRREAGDGTGPICPSPQERQIFVVLLSDDHAPGADTRCRIVAISRRIGAGLGGTRWGAAGSNFMNRCSQMRGKSAPRKGFRASGLRLFDSRRLHQCSPRTFASWPTGWCPLPWNCVPIEELHRAASEDVEDEPARGAPGISRRTRSTCPRVSPISSKIAVATASSEITSAGTRSIARA